MITCTSPETCATLKLEGSLCIIHLENLGEIMLGDLEHSNDRPMNFKRPREQQAVDREKAP